MRGRENEMPPFEIDDAKSFEENVSDFLQSLAAEDPALAGALAVELPRLLSSEIQISDIWEALSNASKAVQS
jgi:hypothetical protein